MSSKSKENLEDQSQSNGKSPRTIFILYVPGGAMLGIIPAMVLSHLEELTETPAHQLFQVVDGVSTGAIVVSALTSPDPYGDDGPQIDAKETVEMFCKYGPEIFPEKPGRYPKMLTANAIHFLQDTLDPNRIDSLPLHDIKRLCDKLDKLVNKEQKETAENLREFACKKWLTKSSQKKALKLCEALSENEINGNHKQIKELTSQISELVFVRSSYGPLSVAFNKSVLAGMDKVTKYWAKDFLFDPKVPENIFSRFLGDNRMDKCLTSTYISSFNLTNNKIKTYFSRKDDFFDMSPDAPRTTSVENATIVDALMGSIANPFAFPPHKTEEGLECTDKAIVHSPLLTVNDVLAHKPADANVKLVVLGTGKYLTSDNEKEKMLNEYAKYGVAGNLIKGRETTELENYTMSTARQALYRSLGKENIVEISPRMAPHTYSESQEYPGKDPLNASADNIRKIVKRAKQVLLEEDETIRSVAFSLAENLYNIGEIDLDKFKRIAKKVGYEEHTKQLTGTRNDEGTLKECFEDAINEGEDKSLKNRMKKAMRKLWNSEPKPPSGP
jgi:patatin-like phospholipase/acyl hydrolase